MRGVEEINKRHHEIRRRNARLGPPGGILLSWQKMLRLEREEEIDLVDRDSCVADDGIPD